MRQGDWACSIDLTDAYFHIPIHQTFRKYLRFAVLGEVYQFTSLPFGLVIAPRIFTMVMLEVAKVIRSTSCDLHQYLDDWLVLHPDPDVLAGRVLTLLTLLEDLGLMVNQENSELIPQQRFTFVGVLYDLTVGRAFPPLDRVQKIRTMVSSFLSQQTMTAGQWLSLVGLLGSVSDQVPLGRLRLRPLQYHLKHHWRMASDDRQTPVPVSEDIKSHLQWWVQPTPLSQGVPLDQFVPTETIYTDASLEGWGGHWKDREVSGVWGTSDKGVHINVLELRAVILTLEQFCVLLQGQSVLVATDNTTTLAYINRQGGTRSQTLMAETVNLFRLTEAHGISIRARHIPGRLNILADQLSRKNQVCHTEWSLHPSVLESLWQTWGKPQIDLFATKENCKLPLYVSPAPDACALAVDALTMSWENLSFYAFPPSPLLQKVMDRFRGTTRCQMILIAPWRPEKCWFADLMRLKKSPPLQLPQRWDLLKQPGKPIFHANPALLNLHAWKL